VISAKRSIAYCCVAWVLVTTLKFGAFGAPRVFQVVFRTMIERSAKRGVRGPA